MASWIDASFPYCWLDGEVNHNFWSWGKSHLTRKEHCRISMYESMNYECGSSIGTDSKLKENSKYLDNHVCYILLDEVSIHAVDKPFLHFYALQELPYKPLDIHLHRS